MTEIATRVIDCWVIRKENDHFKYLIMKLLPQSASFKPSFKSFDSIEVEYYINTFNELHVDVHAMREVDTNIFVQAVQFIKSLNPFDVVISLNDLNCDRFTWEFDLVPEVWTQI